MAVQGERNTPTGRISNQTNSSRATREAETERNLCRGKYVETTTWADARQQIASGRMPVRIAAERGTPRPSAGAKAVELQRKESQKEKERAARTRGRGTGFD